MNRQPVSSSNLRSVGYDASFQTLEIEFHQGGIYEYYNVSPSVHDGLMNASSHGTYFDTNIKKAGYRYSKVN